MSGAINLSQFHLKHIASDGHCIVRCFAEHFEVSVQHVLESLRREFLENSLMYLQFTDLSCEEMVNELEDYIMLKSYDKNTIDLVLESLSIIFECAVYIVESTKPCIIIGGDFKKKNY